MTTIRIPPLVMDGSAIGSADCIASIRLVDALGHPMIGLRTTDDRPVTATATRTIPAGGPAWEVDLTPQSQIARADGRPSYYSVSLRLPQRTEIWRIQVPESPDVLELADLVAGAAVSPGDIIAGRLLPPPGDLPDGQRMIVQNGVWTAAAPSWSFGYRRVVYVDQDYTAESGDFVYPTSFGIQVTLPQHPEPWDLVAAHHYWESQPPAGHPALLTINPAPHSFLELSHEGTIPQPYGTRPHDWSNVTLKKTWDPTVFAVKWSGTYRYLWHPEGGWMAWWAY